MTMIFPDWLLQSAGGLRLIHVEDIELDAADIEVEVTTSDVTVELPKPVEVEVPKEIEVEHDC